MEQRLYQPVSDAAHVRDTVGALKHWDKRRPDDAGEGVAPQNVGQISARVNALLKVLAWLERQGFRTDRDHVLDVGAAEGYGLRPFLLSGFKLDQLHGIDLMADRVRDGLARTPGLDLRVGDATAMPYADRQFALVCEQFCFCHVPDEEAKAKIAKEMMRVSDRFILIHDWRMGSERKKLYSVSQADIAKWFPRWKVAVRYRSQLWPPIGRPLALHAPLLYDIARLFSPLVGSWMTVLERPDW